MNDIISTPAHSDMSADTQLDTGSHRPSWADPSLDQRQDFGLAEDNSIVVQSTHTKWSTQTGHISVYADGFRHDAGSGDWADTVTAVGALSPQGNDLIALHVADARRLGEAILAACELIESDPGSILTEPESVDVIETAETFTPTEPIVEPTPAQPCSELPCDAAYRRRAHREDDLHAVHWGTRYNDANLEDVRWKVWAVAAEDCYWEVRLHAPQELTLDMSTEEVDELQDALRSAQRCADKANCESDVQYALELSEELDELRGRREDDHARSAGDGSPSRRRSRP